jgi:hypothetical protein
MFPVVGLWCCEVDELCRELMYVPEDEHSHIDKLDRVTSLLS